VVHPCLQVTPSRPADTSCPHDGAAKGGQTNMIDKTEDLDEQKLLR
jgi:hypothetical protein